MKSPFSLSPSGVPQNPARNRRQFHRGRWPGPEKSKKEGFFVPPFSPIPTPKVVSGDGLSRPVLVKSTEAKVSAFCHFGARWPGRPWDEAWALRPRRSGVEAGTRV
ncbi:hypothetical protein GOBAR_DD30780 [Gossypium barbadense]|nr:hypothetical protein GOBAR_DD30780 [Gossypium barbadense]